MYIIYECFVVDLHRASIHVCLFGESKLSIHGVTHLFFNVREILYTL